MNTTSATDRGEASSIFHGLASMTIDTPWGPVSRSDLPDTDRQVRDRVLDAARERFAAQGISATSMAELAKAAGISRAWLYRNFASRDVIVRALLVREAQRFADMLTTADNRDHTVEESVTETFIYIIRRGRQDRLVNDILAMDTGAVAHLATSALESYLSNQRAALTPVGSRIAAEAIVRLIISILTSPLAAIDFDDTDAVHTFADRVIPPLLTNTP